jgi:hypothetical protein
VEERTELEETIQKIVEALTADSRSEDAAPTAGEAK